MQVHGDLILPIPGVRRRLASDFKSDPLTRLPDQTKSIKYLEENFAAGDVTLSDEELAAVRNVIEENAPVGAQYSANLAKMLDE